MKVDGIVNPTWEQLQPRVWLSPNQPLTVTVQRGDQTFEKTIVPQAGDYLRSGFRRDGFRKILSSSARSSPTHRLLREV